MCEGTDLRPQALSVQHDPLTMAFGNVSSSLQNHQVHVLLNFITRVSCIKENTAVLGNRHAIGT